MVKIQYIFIAIISVFYLAAYSDQRVIPLIINAKVESSYGETLRITAEVKHYNEAKVSTVKIHIYPWGDAYAFNAIAKLKPGGFIEYSHDFSLHTIKPFVKVYYWFEMSLENGDTVTSPSFYFFYSDNRFAWKSFETPPFIVHWYPDSSEFPENVLDIVGNTKNRIEAFIPYEVPDKIDIYLYQRSADFPPVPGAGKLLASIGYTSGDGETILIQLDQKGDGGTEIKSKIAHEMTHLVLSHLTEKSGTLPVWFDEGLASIIELTPNSDYLGVLETAYQSESLIPMAHLCISFPSESSSNLLAYAQSESFVRYLYGKFGSDGIKRLLGAYRDGAACELGIKITFNQDLDNLDDGWKRATFKNIKSPESPSPFYPWLIFFSVAILTPLVLLLYKSHKRNHDQV